MPLFRNVVKVVLCSIAYLVVQAAIGMMLPMSPSLSAVPEAEKWMTMPALLLVGIVYSAILLLYCRRSSLRTPLIAALAALVLFAVGTFQSQIETWYFRKAFTVITDGDLVLLFVQGLISSIFFAPLAVLICRKGAKPGVDFPKPLRDYDFDRRWWKYLFTALAYLPFYFGFGMLAKLAPVLGATYAGWIADTSLIALLPLWQVFRGALFMGIAVLVISLAFPSAIMPQALRLVHFCEITASMVLYSLSAIALLTRRRAAEGSSGSSAS